MNTAKRPLDFMGSSSQWGGGMIPSPPDKKKKRKSRWAAPDEETDKTIIPGMPTVLPSNLNKEQERQYILHLQIEEISRRLRTGDLGIPPNPEDRSPSPEPIYNNEGKRLNTREYRTRKKLEEERHKLVTEASALNSEYKPPADYKPPVVRVNDKVMIPQEEHPDINFVGLLIGPRGNTLKNLEKETGAKIIIRGKGSVKDGKIGRKDGQPLPGEDEPLHAYVTANNPENVKKAVEKVKEIIKQGIEVPEGENDLRRQQLRELALLNGTLRENDGLAKLKQLQQAQTIVTNTIVCSLCGGTGHIAQDCKGRKPGDTYRMIQNQSQADRAKMDSEYMSLMAELGEGPPQSKPAPSQAPPLSHPPTFRPNLNQPPPNPMGFNPPWQTRPALGGQMNQHPPSLGAQPQPLGGQPHLQPPRIQPPQLLQTTHQPQTQPGLGITQQAAIQQGLLQQQQQALQQQQQQRLQIPPGIQPVQPPSHPPASLSSQIPQLAQLPLGGGPAPVAPPAVNQMTSLPSISAAPMQPPWQSIAASSAPGSQFSTVMSSSAPTMGVPPPMLSAPPPPPPSSQTAITTTLPWLQQTQGAVPPPPPASSAPVSLSAPAPWQTSAAPPPPPSNIPPWQQQMAPPVQPPMSSNIAPPPPPPSSQPGFGHLGAPPPPPPGGFDVSSLSGGVNPLLVAPPPPPPN